ncbi:tRNA (pseudouridine(54)-N(1))-methyltransferase TrmY [Halococcoides cellulosivorans]|uniref:tRNA (pseudouridine(54)-N(1))-methyltransferase n=1 Tax=Halococcoides cellulosivorans TaxID=1679096 RepID=A0A2R4WXI8_9EURY|nr:tRNA (pseudouridine(54)-N(1))-methyltransferase TrmY [Halococcoides cellulosivorans]AWB26256.1 tRNA (pseudouridine(54)-N(1))-methyltransferase TrmY [Halococcoides cellulosivorans]
MRGVCLLAHDAPTDPDFALDDLPGTGRLDLVCRAITASLLLSHDIREDATVWVSLADDLCLTVDGSAVRNLRPDERSTAALIRTALAERDQLIGQRPVEPAPGLTLERGGRATALDHARAAGTLLVCHESGDPIVDVEWPADPVIVCSDHRSFTEADLDAIGDAPRVSVGPRALHADQAITIAHNYGDTEGYERY